MEMGNYEYHLCNTIVLQVIIMNFRDTFDLPKRIELYQKESYMHPTKVAVVV
jgi:hypothetical protein